MTDGYGTKGLKFHEPLLWEKGAKGRCGLSMPKRDIDEFSVEEDLVGTGPDFPDLGELDVVRHFTRLSQWNFCIDSGMYPLGSCTMKYNPKTNDRQAGLPGFTGAHPLLPAKLAQGMLQIMYELEQYLSEITGLPAVSLQPAAGAHGELTGMLICYAYHIANGEQRTKIIIPDTAHGTNPSSAALCGFKPITIKSNEDGILSAKDVAVVMDEETAGIMITNPNTLGFFESEIKEITKIVHKKGGLVYADGANMNAVMGIVDMADIGMDILHLNLHKTFSTPHGGGGPGSGPICVTEELAPFLPIPRVIKQKEGFELSEEFPKSVGKIHAFYGNFGVQLRAYSYIRSMGAENLRKASQLAVLNANYIRTQLKEVYHLPYDRPCMHECVFSDRNQTPHKVTTLDIAKRLMEYGFHPPTIYFPLVVQGALMIEPTETESKEDIDRFIAAMKAIAEEAKETPGLLREAPTITKVQRLNETAAARKPCLCG